MAEKTIRQKIEETAMAPASMAADGHSVVAQDIDKQIRADQYRAAQNAAAQSHLGLQFVKLKAPGAG